jgi:hypothetical protein
MDVNLGDSLLLRPAQNRAIKEALDHFGQHCNNINSHAHIFFLQKYEKPLAQTSFFL